MDDLWEVNILSNEQDEKRLKEIDGKSKDVNNDIHEYYEMTDENGIACKKPEKSHEYITLIDLMLELLLERQAIIKKSRNKI